jgi:hypothetical protein
MTAVTRTYTIVDPDGNEVATIDGEYLVTDEGSELIRLVGMHDLRETLAWLRPTEAEIADARAAQLEGVG